MIEQQMRYADMRDAHSKLRDLPIHVEEWGETSGGTTGVTSKKPMADVRNSEYGAAFLSTWVERHIRIRREHDRNFVSVTNHQHDQIHSQGVSYPVVLNIAVHWEPAAQLTLRHWRIDREHSNAYTAFKELGSPESPTPEQIALVRKRMGLELLEPDRQMDVAALSGLEFDLPCNAVSLVELVKQN